MSIPKITHINLRIHCIKCSFATVLVQIYTSSIVVHFNFLLLFLLISEDQRIEWMTVVVFQEREAIKKSRKINIFNKIEFKINNLMQMF